MGCGGMAATSQPLATAAGLEILAAGGNAADAAVAAAAALNVTEPCSTGIGGDMFALYFEAASGQVTALNGSGRAPRRLTLEMAQHAAPLQPTHPYTITVPGACAGWCNLIERHGSLPMEHILAPAIRLAEQGFPVTPITSHFWQRGAEKQLSTALNGRELTIEGRGPRPGEIFRNRGLARTLKEVADGGKRAFYEGKIAEAIAAIVQQAGGCLTVEDLAAHVSTWEEPILTTYRGYQVYECPPNGQGLAALLALNLLEGFDLAALEAEGIDRLHLEIEALRLAFADTRWYVSDPQFTDIPTSELLSKAYAAERRKLISLKKATLDQTRGAPVASSGTVYLCTVDKRGNACSFINSNYMGFGTGIVPSGWGFSLQNRGLGFSLEAGHPNALAPGKRPYHTIIPALATRHRPNPSPDGRGTIHDLFAVFGVMGGFMQPQGHVQVFSALVDDGLDPQSALERRRFCIEDGTSGGHVALEDGIRPEVQAGLAARGHPVHLVSGYERALFGRGQVILRDPESGVLTGGSDPRADGCAMTLV